MQTLDVTADDSTLNVDLRYQVIATGEEQAVRFQRREHDDASSNEEAVAERARDLGHA